MPNELLPPVGAEVAGPGKELDCLESFVLWRLDLLDRLLQFSRDDCHHRLHSLIPGVLVAAGDDIC
jgi:hypothetical protein